MNLTLKSIAQELGLSKATISWILSGQGEAKGFSNTTIKLVKDYAKQIGYRPNLIARSLSVGSTKTIALIIPAIDDTFYSQMTQSVEKQVQKHGYTLIVCSSEGDGEKEHKLIQTVCSKQVDGLIIAPAKKSLNGVKMLLEESFPIVLIDRYFPELKTNYVIVNNEEASYELASQMIKQGSSKMAMLVTDTHLLVMNKRITGYNRALASAGMNVDARLCVEVNRFDYKNDVVTKLTKLLVEHPDIDGFFFSTHYLALEAIRYFIMHGINYHDRFKLGCFHTTVALDILAPEMLLSMMPIDNMGELAVDVLMNNILNRELFSPKEIVMSNSLTCGNC